MAAGPIARLATKVVKHVAAKPLVGKILIKGDTAAKSFGPAADRMWGMVKGVEEHAERMYGPSIKQVVDATEHLDDAAYSSVVNELETGTETSPAAMITRMRMGDVYSKYRNLVDRGLLEKIGSWTDKYFPKMPKDGMIEEMERRGLIRAAEDIKYISGGRRFANIERQRTAKETPDFVWRKDKAVPLDYIRRGYHRVAEIEMFGPKDEVLVDMLKQIKTEQGQVAYDYMKWLSELKLNRRIGEQGVIPGLTQDNLERGIGSLEALSKLGLAVVPQMFQWVNLPVALRGVAPVIRGLTRMMADSGDARRFAVESGAIAYDTYNIARREFLKETTMGSKLLKYTGFTWADRQLRILASVAGRDAIEDATQRLLADPADREALTIMKTLGVDAHEVLRRGALSPDDILTAGRRASDLTQFRSNVANLPPAWRASPGGRLLTLYKTFAYQQSAFIANQVIKPALHGDLKPLMIMSILFPTVGEISADLGAALRGTMDERPTDIVDRLIDNASHVAAFGIFFDAARALSYNDRSAMMRFVAGPALSDVLDIINLPADALKSGHPFDQFKEDVMKKLLRSTPVVGPRAYRKVFGPPRSTGFLEGGGATRMVERVFPRKREPINLGSP